MSEFQRLLAAEFAPYGKLNESQLTALEAHYELLLRWNRKINLTRIVELQEAVRLHYCESLYLATLLPPVPLLIADVGSGGGFPGVPVAVLRPDCSVTLIESHQRKAAFLREIRGLQNVQVYAGRAEECSVGFDWLVARAVRPSEVLALGLAPRAALLISKSDAASLGAKLYSIPWGQDRVAAIVPRET